ncbi:MAG: LysR substrate-binding domain-containing protein [Pseudomonadota bacterium]
MSTQRYPSFAGLKAFNAVASTGSVARAGEALGISASSISHQLKAFEKELGVRLFENRQGKLHLTVDGEQYFLSIKGPMAQILEATEDVRSAPGRRRVSLTLTPSFAANWLMPRMRDLNNQHPDLELDLISTTRVVDLFRENIDVAIRRGVVERAGCIAEPLVDETVAPVLSPDLWQTLNGAALADAFQTARALVNTTLLTEWDSWSAARGISPPPMKQRFNLETYELTVKAARDGLGIALGRKPLVDDLIATGELVAPFDASGAENVGYFLVYRDGDLSSDVKRLLAWLRGQRG